MSRLCLHCTSDTNEDGKVVKLQVPLRLAGYPQLNAPGGILMAWLCDRCGYDSSAESFASRPELSYGAYRQREAGDPRFPWPPPEVHP